MTCKSYNIHNISLPFVLVIAIFFLSVTTGCRKEQYDIDAVEEAGQCVADSIKAGKIDSALALADRKMREASDSDIYYSWLTQKAVLYYYAAVPDSILSAGHRVLRYVEASEPIEARHLMKSKAEQAICGYYSQYVFIADSAYKYQKRGYESALASGDRSAAQLALANLADLHRLRGELDKAADSYRMAIAMADSLKYDGFGYIPVYTGLGAVYTALHDFRQSKIWWDRAGKLWDEMLPNEKFYYLNNRGNDYYLEKDYKNSLAMFMKLDSFLRQNPGMVWERHFCDANLSDVYLKTGELQKAAPLIAGNLEFFSKTQPNPYAFNHVLTQKMQVLHDEGRDAEVLKLISEYPVDMSVRSDQYLDRYDFLRKFYADISQWEAAYKAQANYQAMEDSIRNERVKLSASEQELRYKRDSEVFALRLDLNDHKHKLTVIYIIAGMCALAVVVLVLVVIIVRRTARIREERMLHKIMHLRIDSIRTRVTPHFIYNALNYELAARTEGKPGNLDSLVDLLRRQQFMADQLTCSLSDELAFADDYVAVECVNISGGVEYTKYVDPDINAEMIQLPSMTLQILVENAFKHGFMKMGETEKKILEIRAEKDNGCVKVKVFNNSPSAPEAPSSRKSRVGMRVIMETIQILNERNRQKITFSISPCVSDAGVAGMSAVISIPINFNFDFNASK